MSGVDDYLSELDGVLQVRGRARRRLLAECRDHLDAAAASHGVEEAVRRFGSAEILASSFDTEVAVRRGVRATLTTVIGVAAVAASTAAMLQRTDPHAPRQLGWAIAFFAFAQISAVCLGLAVLRASALRYQDPTPIEVVVLDRRNAFALGFALLTQFAAAGAVPGRAPAWLVVGAPAIALVALVLVVRAHALARRLDGRDARSSRAPLSDLVTLLRRSNADIASTWKSQLAILSVTTAVAVAAAFTWDQLDQGTAASSRAAAGIECVFVLASFALLGPVLGLWTVRRAGRVA